MSYCGLEIVLLNDTCIIWQKTVIFVTAWIQLLDKSCSFFLGDNDTLFLGLGCTFFPVKNLS